MTKTFKQPGPSLTPGRRLMAHVSRPYAVVRKRLGGPGQYTDTEIHRHAPQDGGSGALQPLDEECAVNTTTYIKLAPAADVRLMRLDFLCTRDAYLLVVEMFLFLTDDHATVHVWQEKHRPDNGQSLSAIGITSISADITSGNLRLVVAVDNSSVTPVSLLGDYSIKAG